MSDLFAPLREPTPASPLPPEEVRRRGDRLRRRRAGLVVTGAVCLAAIVAGGTSLVVGSGARSESAPADTESVQSLLGKVDLAEGQQRGYEGFLSDPELVICGETFSLLDGALGGKGISRTTRGDITARGVSVYPDVATATAVAADLVAEVEGCPQYTDGRGRRWTTDVRPTTHGDQGWAVTVFRGPPGRRVALPEAVQIVRFGANLMFVQHREIHGATLDQLVDWTSDEVGWLMHRQMCLLTDQGCAWRSDADVLRPDGWGSWRLGMSREEIEATAPADFSDFGECAVVDLGVGGGMLSGADELVSIDVPEGVTTPDGLGEGSRKDDVLESYPFADKRGEVFLVRASPEADYVVTLEQGQVTQLALSTADHECDD